MCEFNVLQARRYVQIIQEFCEERHNSGIWCRDCPFAMTDKEGKKDTCIFTSSKPVEYERFTL